jgi:hypothetical protein
LKKEVKLGINGFNQKKAAYKTKSGR